MIWALQHLNYWQRFKALKITSLQRRRECYIIIHIRKLLNGLSPNDINFHFAQSSRKGVRAQVPLLCKSSNLMNQSLYDHSFAVQGARLWISIPAQMCQIIETSKLQHVLTNYLQTIPDTPPMFGYVGVNSNSLLDCTQNMADSELQGWSQRIHQRYQR